ncbi:MAG TPA: hypothetical protein VIK33_01330 [Anaerolineae bacterium]
MDERDKLTNVIDKLDTEQLRMLGRFAEIMAEERRADPMHEAGDPRVRLEQFRKWCAANNLDLVAMEAWVQEARAASGRAAVPAPRAR